MKTVNRKIGLLLMILAGLIGAFLSGRWAGRLQYSVDAEATYPWDLHRKIGSLDITCDKLLSAPRTGNFVVEAMDAGSTLAVVFFDRSDGRISASVLDSKGRYATDSWTLECK